VLYYKGNNITRAQGGIKTAAEQRLDAVPTIMRYKAKVPQVFAGGQYYYTPEHRRTDQNQVTTISQDRSDDWGADPKEVNSYAEHMATSSIAPQLPMMILDDPNILLTGVSDEEKRDVRRAQLGGTKALAKLAGNKYVAGAVINTALAAAFAPAGKGVGRGVLNVLNETVNPLAGIRKPAKRMNPVGDKNRRMEYAWDYSSGTYDISRLSPKDKVFYLRNKKNVEDAAIEANGIFEKVFDKNGKYAEEFEKRALAMDMHPDNVRTNFSNTNLRVSPGVGTSYNAGLDRVKIDPDQLIRANLAREVRVGGAEAYAHEFGGHGIQNVPKMHNVVESRVPSKIRGNDAGYGSTATKLDVELGQILPEFGSRESMANYYYYSHAGGRSHDNITDNINNTIGRGDLRLIDRSEGRITERMAFAMESKMGMYRQGYIKDWYDHISEDTIKDYFKNNPLDRIGTFAGVPGKPIYNRNIPILKGVFNKLLSGATIVGAGSAAMGEK